MSFDTAMWIALALWGAINVGILVVSERNYRRRIRDCRQRWQDECDRRTR
jgi:hypothetical protein